jgi:hypothetical protein
MPRQTVIICWPTDLARIAGMDAAAVSSAAKVPASHSEIARELLVRPRALPGGAFGAVRFPIATRRRHCPGRVVACAAGTATGHLDSSPKLAGALPRLGAPVLFGGRGA